MKPINRREFLRTLGYGAASIAGERVRLLMRFTDFEGLYMYHCHNLEHEDMGMMRNYRVA